jgi:hypothetical protein
MPDNPPNDPPEDAISEIATLLARSYFRLRKSRSMAVVEAATVADPSPDPGLASLAEGSVHVNGG